MIEEFEQKSMNLIDIAYIKTEYILNKKNADFVNYKTRYFNGRDSNKRRRGANICHDMFVIWYHMRRHFSHHSHIYLLPSNRNQTKRPTFARRRAPSRIPRNN